MRLLVIVSRRWFGLRMRGTGDIPWVVIEEHGLGVEREHRVGDVS